VCESGDYLALDRALAEPKAGDLLAIMTAGAYGAVQSSTYNTRPLVPEVLVKGERYAVVRPRVEVDALIAMDKPAPWLGRRRSEGTTSPRGLHSCRLRRLLPLSRSA